MNYPNFNGGYYNYPNQAYNNHTSYMNQGYNSQPNQQKPKQSNVNDAKIAKVQNQLKDCTYANQNAYKVLEAVQKLMHSYPLLISQILAYNQGANLKSFIELKGVIEVNFHGDNMFVFINLMFPQRYPDQAPNIRIINTEPQHFDVSQHYAQFQSKADKNSYMISKMLDTITKWNNMSSIVDVLKESEKLMQKWFPFKKLKPGQKPTSHIINTVVKKQQPVLKKAESVNPNNGFAYPSFNNVPNQGFNQYPNQYPSQNMNFSYQGGNQATNQSMNQSMNKSKQNPINNIPIKKQQSKLPSKPTTNQAKIPAQLNELQQLAKLQIDDYISKNKQFVIISKQHGKDFVANQGLQISKQLLTITNKNIQKQHTQTKKIVKLNENTQRQGIQQLIFPINQWNSQLVEMICIQKACNDTLEYIKNLFENEEITFDQFMKQVRKIEEERFLCNVMIKKKLKDKV